MAVAGGMSLVMYDAIRNEKQSDLFVRALKSICLRSIVWVIGYVVDKPCSRSSI